MNPLQPGSHLGLSDCDLAFTTSTVAVDEPTPVDNRPRFFRDIAEPTSPHSRSLPPSSPRFIVSPQERFSSFGSTLEAQGAGDEEVEAPWSPALAFLVGINSSSPYSRPTSALSSLSLPRNDPDPQVIGAYTLGPTIAHGTFSSIKKAFSSNEVAAVKIVRKTPTSSRGKTRSAAKEEDIEHEASIWSGLSHQNILPLFSTTSMPHAAYFFTLYCPGGSLLDILNRARADAPRQAGLPQDDTGTIFRQVVKGVRYLHQEARIIHRDIKLENVLIDEMGACRIADFGLATRIPANSVQGSSRCTPEPCDHAANPNATFASACAPERPATNNIPIYRPARCRNTVPMPSNHGRGSRARRNSVSVREFPAGSLPYAAPELLVPPTSGAPPSPSQDIWALGCLLHGLLFGRLPFVDAFEPRLQMKIVRGVWELPRKRSKSRGAKARSRERPEVRIGKEARGILRACLQTDLDKRWNIAQLDDMAWGIGWGEVEMEADDEFERTAREGRRSRSGKSRSRVTHSREGDEAEDRPPPLPPLDISFTRADAKHTSESNEKPQQQTKRRSRSRHPPRRAHTLSLSKIHPSTEILPITVTTTSTSATSEFSESFTNTPSSSRAPSRLQGSPPLHSTRQSSPSPSRSQAPSTPLDGHDIRDIALSPPPAPPRRPKRSVSRGRSRAIPPLLPLSGYSYDVVPDGELAIVDEPTTDRTDDAFGRGREPALLSIQEPKEPSKGTVPRGRKRVESYRNEES